MITSNIFDTVFIPSGDSSATINLIVYDDQFFEQDERVDIQINSIDSSLISTDSVRHSATALIHDTFQVTTATLIVSNGQEGDSTTGKNIQIEIRLSEINQTGLPFEFHLALDDKVSAGLNPATFAQASDNDVFMISSTSTQSSLNLTIQNNSNIATHTVLVKDDDLIETAEWLAIRISTLSALTQLDSEVEEVAIVDNDQPLVSIDVSTSSYQEGEVAEFTLRLGTTHQPLRNGLPSPLSLDLQFSGEAEAGADYSTANTAIAVPVGQSTGTTRIQILTDALFEDEESMIVTLVKRTIAGLNELAFAQPSTQVRIIDISQPILAIDVITTSVVEANPQTSPAAAYTAQWRIQLLDSNAGFTPLENLTGLPVTVPSGVAFGDLSVMTAESNDLGRVQNLDPSSIPSGSTSTIVGIEVNDDPIVEQTENIVVTISTGSVGRRDIPVRLDQSSASVFIRDNDQGFVNVLRVSDGDENGPPGSPTKPVIFVLSLDSLSRDASNYESDNQPLENGIIDDFGTGVAQQAINFDLSYPTIAFGHNATAGVDFDAISTAAIAYGESRTTLSLTVNSDDVWEDAETVVIDATLTDSFDNIRVGNLQTHGVPTLNPPLRILDEDAAQVEVALSVDVNGGGIIFDNDEITINVDIQAPYTNETGENFVIRLELSDDPNFAPQASLPVYGSTRVEVTIADGQASGNTQLQGTSQLSDPRNTLSKSSQPISPPVRSMPPPLGMCSQPAVVR